MGHLRITLIRFHKLLYLKGTVQGIAGKKYFARSNGNGKLVHWDVQGLFLKSLRSKSNVHEIQPCGPE